MRLIALLGVLFVLSSCSDSDMEENLGLSCYLSSLPADARREFFEFDFDKNTVIYKRPASSLLPSEEREFSIISTGPAIIVFGGKWLNIEEEFIFDRATMVIEVNFVNEDGTYETMWDFICESSQI